jgi:hypothetical protein
VAIEYLLFQAQGKLNMEFPRSSEYELIKHHVHSGSQVTFFPPQGAQSQTLVHHLWWLIIYYF